jgi:membrane associated rhomboid family serine protease
MKYGETEPSLTQRLKSRIFLILIFIASLWVVELVNLALEHRLNAWGIHPRRLDGLPGILVSPFLHGGISHLLLNTMPLFVLGLLVVLRGVRMFLTVSFFVVLVGGFGVWLLGKSGSHVGASGLIFGYFGFLLAYAWYARDPWSIFLAFLALVLYGGILWGIFTVRAYISWEGHLFGLIAGVMVGRLKASNRASR